MTGHHPSPYRSPRGGSLLEGGADPAATPRLYDPRLDPAATPRSLRAHWPTLAERIASGELKPASQIPRPERAQAASHREASGSAKYARFALAARLDGVTKPAVFDSAAALARGVHRRRDGRAIQVQDVHDLREAGQTRMARVLPRGRPCPGVQILIITDGMPTETLGWAFLDGLGARELMLALRSQPIPLSPRQAAD